MTHYGIYFLLAIALVNVQAYPQQIQDTEHYPIAWTKIDFKPIVDNDRLFKKYKQCIVAEKSTGCPRDITELKKIIPEVIETLCAKCLPEHVERFKQGLEYICQKRRADYDEVKAIKDPTGAIQARFEAKFGKINC